MRKSEIDKLAKLVEKIPEKKEELAKAILNNKHTRALALAGAIRLGNFNLAMHIAMYEDKH